MLAGFLLPAAGPALVAARSASCVLLALCVLHLTDLLADRWLFFADAHHPQTLYHAAGA